MFKASKATTRAVCSVASRKLLNRVLKYRRVCAAELLGTIRSVKTVEMKKNVETESTIHCFTQTIVEKTIDQLRQDL